MRKFASNTVFYNKFINLLLKYYSPDLDLDLSMPNSIKEILTELKTVED